MNYIDAIDVTENNPANKQTLNEEVAQITGQLGRLWGGFRKQGLSALEQARKLDLAQVVTQAQSELGKLVSEEPKPAQSSTSPRSSLGETAKSPKPDATPVTTDATAGNDEKASTATTTAADDLTTPRAPPSDLPPTSPTAGFFSRIQASIPPNLIQSVQGAIPPNLMENIQHGVQNLQTELQHGVQTVQQNVQQGVQSVQHSVQGAGLAQLRGQIGAEFARVQHEANEFLKEAVKVVPPDQAAGKGQLVWDGSDMWMMDVALGTGIAASAAGTKGKEKEVDWSSPVEARRAVATRAQALLRRLRCDPDVLKVDPEGDVTTKELYTKWVESEVKVKEGGISGKEWEERTKQALANGDEDGEALKSTMETLIPSELTEEVFWTRYWFRVHQIQSEEQKRQALLKGSEEKEEEISWEDDDDEPTSPKGTQSKAPKPAAPSAAPIKDASSAAAIATATAAAAAGAELASQNLATPTPTSPRHSEEGSYDVVSATQSQDEKDDSDESDEKSDEGEGDGEKKKSSEEEAPAKPAEKAAPSTKPAPTKEDADESDDSDWE